MRIAMHLGITLVMMSGWALSRVETFEGDISVASLNEIHKVQVLGNSCLRIRLNDTNVVHSTRGNLGDPAMH